MKNCSTDYTFNACKAIGILPYAIDCCVRFQQKAESRIWIRMVVPTEGGPHARFSIR